MSTAVALLTAGCGSGGEEGLSRVEAEKRVSQEVADNEGGRAIAQCVERAKERRFRCSVKIGPEGSFYDVLVSKDGVRIQLIQR